MMHYDLSNCPRQVALIQSLLHSESRVAQPSAEQQETEDQAKAAHPQQAEGLSTVQVATVDSFQVPFHDFIPYQIGLLNICCCSF